MELPNYFIADQAPAAELSATFLTDACQTLRRNRQRYLLERPTDSLIRTITDVAQEWLRPSYPFRKVVLEQGPKQTGFPAAIIATGLDNFFSQITVKNLEALILQEFGHRQRLDQFSANYLEEEADRAAIARGPELIVHITGGVLPNSVITNIIFGFLVKSAQLVKCASGTSFIPRMFAHSIYEAEPKLGACLEIAEWRGGKVDLEKAVFAESDCVTATGSDETIAAIKHIVPPEKRFLTYGHRLSFGYVANDMLTPSKAARIIAGAADDAIAWNQLGCLSPHVFYVESGGAISPEKFAELLAGELHKREETSPRGEIAIEESAHIAYRRSFYEVRAISTETRLWKSENSTAWTVVYENDPKFQMSCLNRFVYVKAVANLAHALQGTAEITGKVSTVGLAATGQKARTIATDLARWGVTRICPIGQMQNPPITWRHDGRPALADFVTWTDWETTF